jgi:ADP-ribosyl-[dinitrogen reductase] hydrolase
VSPDQVVRRDRRRQNRLHMHRWLRNLEASEHAAAAASLLGLAVGDVLGCPVEGWDHRRLAQEFPRGLRGLVQVNHRRHWRLAGLHSDDTQQALIVLRALMCHPTLDEAAANIAQTYVRGARDTWRGTGRGFRGVVERLGRAGESPFSSAAKSAGLGAAMRVGPAGLLCRGTEEVFEMCVHVSAVTHADALASVSAAVIAETCRLVGTDPGPSRDELMEALLASTRVMEDAVDAHTEIGVHWASAGEASLMSELVGMLPVLVGGHLPGALGSIRERVRQVTGGRIDPLDGYGPSGTVACLYFFLRDYDDPEACLLRALNAGGDTDTVGAIVGAMAGARHGCSAYVRHLPELIGLSLMVRTLLDPSGVDLVAEEELLSGLEEDLRQAKRNPKPKRGWR